MLARCAGHKHCPVYYCAEMRAGSGGTVSVSTRCAHSAAANVVRNHARSPTTQGEARVARRVLGSALQSDPSAVIADGVADVLGHGIPIKFICGLQYRERVGPVVQRACSLGDLEKWCTSRHMDLDGIWPSDLTGSY